MNVHYINILLFALPLNILVNTDKKPSIAHLTPTNRSLCECDLYMPNYDNDPQMKKVMDNFNKQTQQRLRDYDDRMKTTREKCKEKCDKEIQKIILKDKMEKQMEEQLTTLETKINTDDIPTCICEKSLADKTEKFCLNCGKNMGAIAPWWGLVCGAGYGGWSHYVATTLVKIAKDAGIEAGVKWGIQELKDFSGLSRIITSSEIKNLINPENYANGMTYVNFIQKIKTSMCEGTKNSTKAFCNAANYQRTEMFLQRASKIAEDAKYSAELSEAGVLSEGASTTSTLTSAITASVIAIVVIILVMVIIYLILRYRRKKKMKKKLQYIKLLKE
ncbi:rifin PIR protein, putative [Plasmodium reichenowi]|uniref:Rifin PIR protein, putative n=1 Tax=Plasmodium reichenowi TaxID=5854 RepID=A0A2P9DL13_PLARE|nr:rifin PIR protein, putative [Plasmodium reichenowi]